MARKNNNENFQNIYTRSNKGEAVTALCREYKVSQPSYYAWRKRNTLTATTTGAMEVNTTVATATSNNENNGFLLYGTPKFLAQVISQLN